MDLSLSDKPPLCLQVHLLQEALSAEPLEPLTPLSPPRELCTAAAFSFVCPSFPNSLLVPQGKGRHFVFVFITLNVLSTSGYSESETEGSQKMN